MEFYKDNGLAETMARYKMTKDQLTSLARRERIKEQQVSSGIELTYALELRTKAMKHASNRGHSSQASDFASYCMIRLYEGKESPIEYMLPDYLRLKTGKKSATNQDKFNATHDPLELSKLKESNIRKDVKDRASMMDIYEMLDSIELNGTNRVCFLLHVLFGFKQWEIALCVGVHETQVARIIFKAGLELRAAYEVQDR